MTLGDALQFLRILARCPHDHAKRAGDVWCTRCGAMRARGKWVAPGIAVACKRLDEANRLETPPEEMS